MQTPPPSMPSIPIISLPCSSGFTAVLPIIPRTLHSPRQGDSRSSSFNLLHWLKHGSRKTNVRFLSPFCPQWLIFSSSFHSSRTQVRPVPKYSLHLRQCRSLRRRWELEGRSHLQPQASQGFQPHIRRKYHTIPPRTVLPSASAGPLR